MYFDRKCKITFISHGATIYSEEYRFSDIENYPPLNEAGQEEMEKICEFLKQRGIKNNKIYSSAETRTVQSAEMVAKVYKQDFEILHDMSPKKMGKFNGLTFSQIEAKYPDVLYKMIDNPEEKIPEDAESVNEFVKRIKKSLCNIINNNLGSRIIIVTNPDVIKAAICIALDIPHESLQRIYIKTGSATQISYFEKWSSLVYSGHVPV